jgi:hypothetical protein
MSDGKIFARNLTARAAHLVAGNPASTRLESGVGNCFPGLEFDHRNLDRRFCPGLIVDFISQGFGIDPNQVGVCVASLEPNDSGLTPRPDAPADERDGLAALAAFLGATTPPPIKGWFLLAIQQGGRRIELIDRTNPTAPVPLDGMTAWWLIRTLEAGPVELEFQARAPSGSTPQSVPPPVRVPGWRRRYTDPKTGVISLAYVPGEMSQSLCSPWQHDFRDCGCTYWASNHPDIVMLEVRPGSPTLPTGDSANPERTLGRVQWQRSDRDPDRAPESRETFGLNRAVEMDHYEINLRWQTLAVVIGDREVPDMYVSRMADAAQPFASPVELAESITKLATLEHLLALEYLYAYFSVRIPTEVADGPLAVTLRDDVEFIRHFVLLVAVNEMQHLRSANQILWELKDKGLIDPAKFGPSLGVSPTVPVSASGPPRPRQLRPLTPQTLADFVAVERPSGFIEGQYARAVATLRLKAVGYPETAYQLASRIANEGVEHFSRFRDIQAVMRQYSGTPWLRAVTPGDPASPPVAAALAQYAKIVSELTEAYKTGSVADRVHITQARLAMTALNDMAEALAAKGIGVPYFS